MMYQLAQAVAYEIEVKKSRFLGHLYPVQTRQEAKQLVLQLRQAHPAAVHVCWALICDTDSGLDDDGEPGGTAAKPMYNVLVHKQINNVLAVVVRYWGGVKLGAGGLTRAYGQAISETCKIAQLIAPEITREFTVIVAYAAEAQVRHWVQVHQGQILACDYQQQTHLQIKVKEAELDALVHALQSSLKGQLELVMPLASAS